VRLRIRLLFGAVLCAPLGAIATIAIAERAMRMPFHAIPPESATAGLLVSTRARLEPVEVHAADGALLRAWFFTPNASNGAAVIALHGVGATRVQVLDRAQFLLDAGYAVLTPDSRGHGGSGGARASYGLLETEDMRRWADFVLRRPGISRLYGLGLSMGASILIQTLPTEPRFRALVADCPFATFEEAAYNRLGSRLYLPRVLARPVIEGGLLYARTMYSVDLRRASPADSMRNTNTPVLLIHGLADGRTPIYHSHLLHAANPASTELWEVEGADHGGAIRVAPDRYRRRVLEWFGGHP
jgi:dipeptidyl aminopeptidase/acylaminoacyl peptidase